MTEPTPAGQQNKQNGTTQLLMTLASSGDNWVKLGTLGLVALSGVGNWVTTNQNAQETRHRVDDVRAQAAAEIHELYFIVRNAVEEFHRNNEDSRRAREAAEDNEKYARDSMQLIHNFMDNRGKLLEEQTQMLKAQQQLLVQIRQQKDPNPPDF